VGSEAGASTTRPSANTAQEGSRGRPRHVRWVFPSPMFTPDLAGRHVIGREESCDTVLHGTEISRRHAEFRVDGPVLAVRDLDSRNGIFVNGFKRSDAPLIHGDVIRCGEWIGIAVADGGAGDFKEIAPGWFGGAALFAAAEPVRRVGVDLPIVVQGETGTGKEGMARAFHSWSARPGPFVAVNCATLPAQLAEAELFGYRKGAFSGADQASPGLFRAAQRGTIFLDEVLELSPTVQPKLLRALEQREVLPLGETKAVAIDVRVLTATQEPLADAVADRRFRADLHARLDGLTVVLPPLRERREDIFPLFQEFLRQNTGGRPPELEAKLVEALCVYKWPLNVRELLLLTRRLLAVHGSERLLGKTHLPDRLLSPPPDSSHPTGARSKGQKRVWRKTDDEAEFEALLGALQSHGGSVARAAVAIGVSRARAYRLLSARPDSSPERTDR
jgi:transcriptional regulator with AAA-type ATPase domain